MSSSQKQATKSTKPTSTTQSAIQQFNAKLHSLRFYWFVFHFFAIFFSVLNFINSSIRFTSSQTNLKFFQYSLNSILITYLIVLRQTYKSKPISFVLSQGFSLLRDDNVQYFLLALIFRLNSKTSLKTISGCLYPFIIFAFFHCLNYFNSNLLNLLPFIQAEKKKQISNSITNFIKNYNERSLIIASNFELFSISSFIFPLIKLVLFLRFLKPQYFFQNLQTIYLFLSVVIFNKLRYDQSKYTKLVVNNYDMKFNQFVYNSPMVPANMKTNLTNIRSMVVYYLSFVRIPSNSVQKKRS